MRLEEHLPDAMRDTVRDVRPDVATLVAGGIERGRRDARRARIARLVGAGAVLALVGGLAIALPLGESRQDDAQVAGTTRVEAPPPKAAGPKVPITPQAVLRHLVDRLPADAKTSHYGGFGDPGKWVTAQLLWTTPQGRSRVSVTITFDDRPFLGAGWDADPCDEKLLKGNVPFCSSESVGDGAKLVLQRADYQDGRKDELYSAWLLRADHLVVQATVSGTERLASPPLTLDELAEIVKSPVWQATVDKAFADAAKKRYGELPADPLHPKWPPPSTGE